MTDSLLGALQNISTLEIVSVVFGLAYVILAARGNIWCWPAALIGTGTGIVLFFDASLLMESALNVFYLLIAIYGWWRWRHGGDGEGELLISRRPWHWHLVALLVIAALTFASATLLSAQTTAALPWLDSFTTWSAVICTWMVTAKILENWLYWVVIDAASVYLYIDRELYLYAVLFAAYTLFAVYGYFRWRSQWRLQHVSYQ